MIFPLIYGTRAFKFVISSQVILKNNIKLDEISYTLVVLINHI